jgi:SNF2 family DNA or RNA helicase
LSNRWKNLSDEERQPYLDLHAADAQRFEEESYAADVAAFEKVEMKRKAAEEEIVQDGAVRGARAQIEQERAVREERRMKKKQAAAADDSEQAQMRREILAHKKAEVKERRDKREEEQKVLAKQHKKLDKEEAKKAAARLEYLLKQSSIFAKLQGGKGALPGVNDQETAHPEKKKRAATGGSARQGGVHHLHNPDSANEDDDDENEDEEEGTVRHIFLTKQPSSIKFGQLKAYQLESLNWMIHLAEKGLNGILADGKLNFYFHC